MTIASADYGAFGAVTETLPAGFGCASSGLDDEDIPGRHPMTTPILETRTETPILPKWSFS